MDEQVLLRAAILTALLGLGGLWLTPQLPRTEVTGTLAWTNNSQALILSEEPRWVDLQAPTTLRAGSCVTMRGYQSNGRLVRAVATPADPRVRRRCP